LGVNPTEWATRWAAPWLTEILYCCYLFYFPMPLILLGWMYAPSTIPEIEESYFVYLTCYYVSYVLYFICPAEGPRFHLAAAHPEPLPGLALTEPMRGLIDAPESQRLLGRVRTGGGAVNRPDSHLTPRPWRLAGHMVSRGACCRSASERWHSGW
jgi:hypothetical protein